MERFINGGCYVVVKAPNWPSFTEMCDAAGLTWGASRARVSGYEPEPINAGRPVRAFVFEGKVLWAPVSAPKTRDIPVVGFQNLKPLAKRATGAGIVSDGVRVTARLFAGAETVNTARAACSPNDTFRFGPGAMLAMFRALETEEDRTLAMDLIGEERIKQLEPEIPHIRTLLGRPAKHSTPSREDDISGLLAEALSNVFGTQVVVVQEGETRRGKSPIMRLIEDALPGGVPAGSFVFCDLTPKAEGVKQ